MRRVEAECQKMTGSDQFAGDDGCEQQSLIGAWSWRVVSAAGYLFVRETERRDK